MTMILKSGQGRRSAETISSFLRGKENETILYAINSTYLRRMTMESRYSLAKKFANFFWGLFAEIFWVTSLWGKNNYFFFLALFLVRRSSRSTCLFFISLINTAHQTRLTFDFEIETAHGHSSSLRTKPHECR